MRAICINYAWIWEPHGGFILIGDAPEDATDTQRLVAKMTALPVTFSDLRDHVHGYFFFSRQQVRELLEGEVEITTQPSPGVRAFIERLRDTDTLDLPEESEQDVVKIDYDIANTFQLLTEKAEPVVGDGLVTLPFSPWTHFVHAPTDPSMWSGAVGHTEKGGNTWIEFFFSIRQAKRIVKTIGYRAGQIRKLEQKLQKLHMPPFSDRKSYRLEGELAKLICGLHSAVYRRHEGVEVLARGHA